MLDNSSPFARTLPPGPDSKNAVALRRLKHALLTCEITPGAGFTEAEVAARYRLGRASVRAALVSLAADGFVRPEPRQGWRAAPITGALIGEILCARRRLEPALAETPLSEADAGRLEALVRLNAAIAGRNDVQAIVTARVTDREILNILAVGAGLFARRWLTEVWDHNARLLNFLDGAGARYRPGDREPLISALKRRAVAAAASELERDIARVQSFAADALMRLPAPLATAPETPPARSRRTRAAPGTDSPLDHHARRRG